jgi:predicted component of type VI protein secretion system
MRHMILAGLVSAAAAGCASNKTADEPGARIRDTTATARDSVNPNDTLPHIRDTMPDSTSR